MKIFCCYTPAHEILYRDWFLPTVPAGFEVVPAEIDLTGPGDFLSREFIECIGRKVELILASLRENAGAAIIWSDVDIRFFALDGDALLAQLGAHDIAFQREGKTVEDVNTGFFVCRCNARVEAFFEKVREGLRRNPATNEQYVINDLLKGGPGDISWTRLPLAYYARTHGWPPPKEMALYHANATPGKDGVALKIRQFREVDFVRRYGWPALVLTMIKYAPKRIRRLLAGKK